MNILLVSPGTPPTFWSYRYALKFVAKKSSEPPLGLLTVAALLPPEWDLKLVDMNVSPLRDEDIRWADYLYLTGMNVHLNSMREVIARAKRLGIPVVVGGPLATTDYQQLEGVDHFVLNEAEITLPRFLSDLENGKPRFIYTSREFPDIAQTPIPRWDLLEMKKYASMSVQYSRGCPYNCDFCNITILNGKTPRTKSTEQFLAELESLYRKGWRGSVFVVDDNFIGNRRKLKTELLPALTEWSAARGYPFNFITEASVNLADDEKLMELMSSAGFDSVFVGIETPNEASLGESGKTQNIRRNLIETVKRMQHHGLMVAGGFIVGFDHDPPNIFEQQIRFIQKSGIMTAMVGLLSAPTGTRLFRRLKAEGRLLKMMSGNNMDGTTNIIPKMDMQQLKAGYRRILHTIYSPRQYYKRLVTFLQEYRMPARKSTSLPWRDVLAFFKSIWILGIREKGKQYYWKLLGYSLLRCPRKFPLAVRFAIYGYHFRRVAEMV